MSSLRIDLEPLRSTREGAERGSGPPAGPDPDRGPGRGRTGRRRWGRRLLLALLLAPLVPVVPLGLLVRGSVELHARTDLGVTASLAGGALSALAALGLILTLVAALVRVPGGVRRLLTRGALLLAGGWIVSGLLFVAAQNTKGDEVAAEYRALHPFLRVASATLVLADRGTVLTDAARTVEDYAAMGLPPNEASLHFEQPDGWVHALDLRTVGRHEVRNALVEAGFRLMGFETLRHTGTADHLHVSIPR